MVDKVIHVKEGQIPALVLRAMMGKQRYSRYAQAGAMTCRGCGAILQGWRGLAEHIVNNPSGEQHKASQRWAKGYLCGSLPRLRR